MTNIKSRFSMHVTMSKLENALIEYNIFTPAMFGFIGSVDPINKRFWIVNHSNVYKTRSGFRFKTYRRFEGSFRESVNGIMVEGDFKIRPLFKVSIGLYFTFICLMCFFGIIASSNFQLTLKLMGVLLVMLTAGIGIVAFNLSSTKESELDIIEFIESVIN